MQLVVIPQGFFFFRVGLGDRVMLLATVTIWLSFCRGCRGENYTIYAYSYPQAPSRARTIPVENTHACQTCHAAHRLHHRFNNSRYHSFTVLENKVPYLKPSLKRSHDLTSIRRHNTLQKGNRSSQLLF